MRNCSLVRRHEIGEPQASPFFRLANGEVYIWAEPEANDDDLESSLFHSSHFSAACREEHVDPYHRQARKGTVALKDLSGDCPPAELPLSRFCKVDKHFQHASTEYRVKESSDVEWGAWKIEILRRLLHASLETGNPIQWC